MPTLNWIGKENVVTHHLDVPYRVLDRKYTFGDAPDSGNMIIHGDNLEALKALLPEYEGKIKCIYIDPPYNTGNEGWVYNDNVSDQHVRRWLGQVVGSEADDLTRHDKWLCMMYPRLVLLQHLLSEDGVIFISIDDNEQANLKLICDEIFGNTNFVEIFSWRKTYTPSNLSHTSKKCLEYVYCYAKKKSCLCRFKGLMKTNEADNPLLKSNNQYKTLVFPKDKVTSTLSRDMFFPAGKYGTKVNVVYLENDVNFIDGQFQQDVILNGRFIWNQDMLNSELSKKTKIIFKGKSFAPRYDRTEYNPEVPRNLIDEEDKVGTTEEGGKLLQFIFGRKVFDYPKVPSLIEYLINFLCDKDSIILDSFAGSGTTAHAVLNLNKQDGGSRKFILCEMMDYAENITAERVRRVMKGYGEGKNAVEGTGGSFDFYELGETIFDPVTGNLNDDADTEQIRRYVWFSETNSPYIAPGKDSHPYLLGTFQGNNYYFYYIRGEETCLDWDFLRTFTQRDRAEMYIIYADRCLLTADEMLRKNIRFKKIPRDIKRV